jgi:hypothetical protein
MYVCFSFNRCHRIGQTRDVHVYRLITEYTIEENIFRKQLVKRTLDQVVVDQGQFTTNHLCDTSHMSVKDLLLPVCFNWEQMSFRFKKGFLVF